MEALIQRKLRNKASAAKSRAHRKKEKEDLRNMVQQLKIENAQLRAYILAFNNAIHTQPTQNASTNNFIPQKIDENDLTLTHNSFFDFAGMADLSDFTETSLPQTSFFDTMPP